MSLVSKNIFDLLGEDDSPAPAPKAAPKAAAPSAPAASRNVPGAAPRGGARSSGNTRHTVTRDNRVADNEGTETAGGFDGERVPASKKGNSTRDAHTKGPRNARAKTSGGHSSQGQGHYKGGKVPAQAGERRQFEKRQQGGDSQRKVEHGWGAKTGEAELKDEVEGEKDAQTAEITPATPAEGEAGWAAAEDAPATGAFESKAEEVEEEPEEVTKSYEEYLAEKAQQNLSIAELGKKQAREVSGNLEGTAFVREGLNDFFSGKAKASEAKPKAKKEKVFIEFDGQFAQPSRPPRENTNRREGGDRPSRGRGQRGGFGGQRGGQRGGAGAPRGAPRAPRAPVINANDTKAFPALGA